MARPAAAETHPSGDVRLQLGIEHCRVGNWDAGLAILTAVFAERTPTGSADAAIAATYLGYASALRRKAVADGLALCQQVAEREFYQPEVHYNYARTLVLAGHKARAVRSLDRALAIDPTFAQAFHLRCELGERRKPVVPFLGRRHVLNRVLGRLRAAWSG
jgi:predicted Zn-dependent protease